MKLRLKEIIWEVTSKCNNGCSYCGSRAMWSSSVDEDTIRVFADKIAEYPPEEIDISGGDPLLVSYDTHQYIKNKLSNTKCKILFNPKSFLNTSEEEKNEKFKILDLYDHFGVSINTKQELDIFHAMYGAFKNIKYTVITNFNLTNFFLFDLFAEKIRTYRSLNNSILWQIQFTMYKSPEDSLALYNHPEAVANLNASLNLYPDLDIIIADNANRGECAAGIHSLGLLSDGHVVPCLSMRSWDYDILGSSQGNLHKMSLKEIWESGFRKNRFEECLCCKDYCNKQIIERTVKLQEPLQVPTDIYRTTVFKDGYPVWPAETVIAVYAVAEPPFKYPRFNEPAVTLYGVSTTPNTGWQMTNETTSKNRLQAAMEQQLKKDAKKDGV